MLYAEESRISAILDAASRHTIEFPQDGWQMLEYGIDKGLLVLRAGGFYRSPQRRLLFVRPRYVRAPATIGKAEFTWKWATEVPSDVYLPASAHRTNVLVVFLHAQEREHLIACDDLAIEETPYTAEAEYSEYFPSS